MMLMGGDGPHLGRGRADVGIEDGADLAKAAVGEDEANIAAAEFFEMGAGGVRVILDIAEDALAYNGVLVHEDRRTVPRRAMPVYVLDRRAHWHRG